jgi:Fic/DOC family
VIPGRIRTDSVVVVSYLAAPATDCEYLLDRLIDWLNGPLFINDDPEIQFALLLAKAVYAHLYLAWIHPFGDGNGRTARLVEFLILAGSGRRQQIEVAWINYVHERFASQPDTPASHRARSLVLAMPMDAPVPRDDLDGLTPKIAKLYAGTGPRVLSRDLNKIEKLGLIAQTENGYAARLHLMQALLPPIAATES